jgi:hypothetical protein
MIEGIKRLICKLFGHDWAYYAYFDLDGIRWCKRCDI